MEKIKVSAPGKLHLLGEHTVVYGKPAILAAINKRLFVTLTPSNKKTINGAGKFRKEIKELLQILETKIKSERNIKKISNYTINIDSQFPIGSGLGSSAALSAALTGALFRFLSIPWNKKNIFEIAYEGEKFFHGNPSGGDLVAVIEGGLLWFRKDFDFLKTFEKLHAPNRKIKEFLIVNSGKPEESTKEMIGKVAKLMNAYPKRVENIFNSQEKLIKQLTQALLDGDEKKLINCITEGEKNLEKLNVVGKKARAMITKIKSLGGIAKISGAGGLIEGSGILVAYVVDRRNLKNLLKSQRYNFEKIRLGEGGLRLEK